MCWSSGCTSCGSSDGRLHEFLKKRTKPPYPVYNNLSRYEQLKKYHEYAKHIPTQKENLPYFFVFDWELDTDWAECVHMWLMDHWPLSFVFAALYLILVFWGRHWMRNRPAWEMKKSLIAWNLFLSVFSILGASRAIPEFYHSIRGNSLYYSMCLGNHLKHNPVVANWGILFAISKVIELGDTAFIVLRKQRLLFLHWYHHITVLLYAWFSCAQGIPTARYFATLNYTVHALMYPYYLARAAKIRVPRRVAMFITLFQLTQMIFGVYANAYSYFAKKAGLHCETPWENIYVSALMYLSYFLLFLNFFIDAYIRHAFKGMKNAAAQGKSVGEELEEYLKIN
ncbi:unnamed protein product [Darwinula stevensoni]|uniref:Elongation of very long chain fatty acids protein n=1 Tax=Darwinula stevensoni TaxID=69355 RepID=A0A7R8X7B4_9CRUS|nr:unnamed protein product [Darwinula stevensoni]CAG0880310.1 unnamed protein product [Darwinula stevensoni]